MKVSLILSSASVFLVQGFTSVALGQHAQITVAMIYIVCVDCVVPLGSHIKWNQNTENDAEDPAGDTEGAHIFGSFALKLCPWNRLVSNRKRSMSRLYIVTLLIYMQSTSCEMPGWMKLKMESKWQGEISITSDTKMTPPLWQKVKKN